jgi:alpha-1,2-glucosyltransferase
LASGSESSPGWLIDLRWSSGQTDNFMDATSKRLNRQWIVVQATVLVLVLGVLLVEFKVMSNSPLLVDENYAFRQISRFLRGDISVEPGINMIPGYHALVALLLLIFHKSGAFSARFVSVWISIVSVAVFYLLTWKIYGRPSLAKTLQYTFLPLLFPFFALIYTDILALLLVLIAIYLVLWKHYALAGFVGILSVFARTNNIIWLVFLYVLIYYDLYKLDWRSFPKSLRQTWIFWVGFSLFFIFLVVNQGIALTVKSYQPMFMFQTGNVFFLLFLFFFLFLPMNIANFPSIVQFAQRHKWTIAGIAGLYLFYMFTFQSIHPANQIRLDLFLRNVLLMRVTSSPVLKSLFFLPVAYSLFSLAVTDLQAKLYYWLYPFTLLSLIPFSLIEPRYSFVPLSLFILVKKEHSRQVEWITVGMYGILSAVILYFTRKNIFFI